MYTEVEKIIDEFYKLYYKIEQLHLDTTIKCLTANEIHIINAIGQDKLTMNDLADRLDITMGTVSVSVNKLEKKKFIYRMKSFEDKRKIYVALTKKGEIAYNFSGDFNVSIIKKAAEKISKKDLKTFYDVFKKMTISLYEIRRKLQPDTLYKFRETDELIIDEVRGNEIMIKYFAEKGFTIGKKIKIFEKTKSSMTIEISGSFKTISSEDAQLVYVIKKEV